MRPCICCTTLLSNTSGNLACQAHVPLNPAGAGALNSTPPSGAAIRVSDDFDTSSMLGTACPSHET